MKNVIVFGSMNMDLSIESDHMPTLGETIVGSGFITNAGGKGANQAVAAAKLGADVFMLGAVGTDAFGNQLIAEMVDQGVICDNIARKEGVPTGVALITRVHGDNFITIDSGANFSTNISDVCESLDKLANPGDVFLMQLECDKQTTWAAAKAAHERGMYVVINPAPAAPIPREVLPNLNMVVVNEGECETITGIYPNNKQDGKLAAEKLMHAGVLCVVITLGERGSLVFCEGEYIECVPDEVSVVDTTCAGDTYIGALVAAYARGLSLAEGAALANKASALACTKVGAQQSIPTLAELNA